MLPEKKHTPAHANGLTNLYICNLASRSSPCITMETPELGANDA